jgi:hypothetical protein
MSLACRLLATVVLLLAWPLLVIGSAGWVSVLLLGAVLREWRP